MSIANLIVIVLSLIFTNKLRKFIRYISETLKTAKKAKILS